MITGDPHHIAAALISAAPVVEEPQSPDDILKKENEKYHATTEIHPAKPIIHLENGNSDPNKLQSKDSDEAQIDQNGKKVPELINGDGEK
jgi:hypothetical protein